MLATWQIAARFRFCGCRSDGLSCNVFCLDRCTNDFFVFIFRRHKTFRLNTLNRCFAFDFCAANAAINRAVQQSGSAFFAYVSGLIRAAKRAKNKFRRNLFPALHTNFRAFHISPLNYLLTIIILSYAYIVNVFVSLSKTSYSLLLLKVAKKADENRLPCFSRYFDFTVTSF